MVAISVIIPIYNVENYLEECLDSIINQTFTDLEIICINDGSTDNSLAILEKYQKQDSRIKIITQKNKGAGASRNLGIGKATGEYIYFMDSDDILQLNALELTYNLANEKNIDFVMFKLINFDEDTNEIMEDDYYSMPYLKELVGEKVFNYEDITDIALDLSVCPPGNLFKRELISDVRFPEDILFEDNIFFTNALFKANRIYFYDEFLYTRRIRSGSITTQMSPNYFDLIDMNDKLIDLCIEFKHDKKHKKELYERIFNNIYTSFKEFNNSQKAELFFELKGRYLKFKDKWESDDYFKNNLNPKNKRIFYSAINSYNYKEFISSVEGDESPNDNKLKNRIKRLIKLSN